jgi:hypothetical protein
MKKRNIVISLVVVLGGLVAYSVMTGKSGIPTANLGITTAPTSNTSTQNTNPSQLVLPTTTGNPIVNNSVSPGFVIATAIVENNTYLITKQVTNDHLEVTLKNTSAKDITQFETYYVVKDSVANVSDAYYTQLTSFALKAGKTKAFYFDNTGQANHYPENKHSIYRTSRNPMQFDVMVSAPNYQVQTITIKKDKGGTEKVEWAFRQTVKTFIRFTRSIHRSRSRLVNVGESQAYQIENERH